MWKLIVVLLLYNGEEVNGTLVFPTQTECMIEEQKYKTDILPSQIAVVATKCSKIVMI